MRGKNLAILVVALVAVGFLIYSFFVVPNSDRQAQSNPPAADSSSTTGNAPGTLPPNARPETRSGAAGSQGNAPAAAPSMPPATGSSDTR